MTLPGVVVVGADGFLGRHVRDALAMAGHPVLSLTRAEPDAGGQLRRRLPADSSALRNLLAAGAIEVVVNCAGATRGSRAELELANVSLVARLLESLAGTGIRLVHIGSAAEYGPGEPGRLTRENHTVPPLSEYGITKLAATRLVVAAADQGDVDGMVLRVFNPIGAGISIDRLPGRAAHEIRSALHRGGEVHLGPLGATRDFVDARDVADAAVATVATGGLGGRVLNIGSGQAATGREMVMLLADVAGYQGAIIEDPAAQPHAEATDWQVADIGAAAAALGWSPRRTLREAVTALWEAG